MIDQLRPSGVFLAALAAWSLGLLLLAFAGLGGRFGPHPDDASLAPPLPEARLSEQQSRLGPLAQYAEIGQRPLFVPDRRPPPVQVDADAASEAPLDVVLTSVLIAGDVRIAVVQNKGDGKSRRVRVGDLLEGSAWRLTELQPRAAVFLGPTGRADLALRVFDGSGGQPPTPVSAPAAPAATAAAPVAPTPGATAPSTSGQAPPPPGGVVSGGQPAPTTAAQEMTPEQQVEAIRQRIEARRALRAREAAEERAASEQQQGRVN